jgi:single-strand DNA-binding protein
MSAMTTPVTVVGRVITDMTTRVTPGGDKVTNFRMACQERQYDKELGIWVDGDRMYLGVACWRGLADGVAASLSRGDQVVVHGRLRIREYTTEEGARRAAPEIDARAVGPDLAVHTATVHRPSRATGPEQISLINPPGDARQPDTPEGGTAAAA